MSIFCQDVMGFVGQTLSNNPGVTIFLNIEVRSQMMNHIDIGNLDARSKTDLERKIADLDWPSFSQFIVYEDRIRILPCLNSLGLQV